MSTVLVVDDDELIRTTVSLILEDAGYLVETAENGRAALGWLDAYLPALILLDISMPLMDGYDFVEELSRRGLHPRLPIVVLTADGRAPQKAEQVGAVGYLYKPFSIDDLLAAVGRVVT